MAKVLRKSNRNHLTHEKTKLVVSVSDAYSNFLRIKKMECAEPTWNIYKELGDRYFIPQLSQLTGDDMFAVTPDVLRTILNDYAVDSAIQDCAGLLFLICG